MSKKMKHYSSKAADNGHGSRWGSMADAASVNKVFLERARKALFEAGLSALGLLAANPGVSKLLLAEQLNRGVSAIGLAMAIYEEAGNAGMIRDVAKDMLIREILCAFPNGWVSTDSVHPLVKLGFWDDDVRLNVTDTDAISHSRQILRHLTIDNPPPDGWRPQTQNDPTIDDLFDRFWPLQS